MGSQIANPLDQILEQAAKVKPRGKLDAYAERLNYSPSAPTLWLLDTSGSMGDELGGGLRKIDLLQQALVGLPPADIPYAFGSLCQPLGQPLVLPEPSGSTALHLALEAAAGHNPRHTLVISDGRPDQPEVCLGIVPRITGVISTLYIGPEGDRLALEFMQRLARAGCGQSATCDLTRRAPQLKAAIRGLLPGQP